MRRETKYLLFSLRVRVSHYRLQIAVAPLVVVEVEEDNVKTDEVSATSASALVPASNSYKSFENKWKWKWKLEMKGEVKVICDM